MRAFARVRHRRQDRGCRRRGGERFASSRCRQPGFVAADARVEVSVLLLLVTVAVLSFVVIVLLWLFLVSVVVSVLCVVGCWPLWFQYRSIFKRGCCSFHFKYSYYTVVYGGMRCAVVVVCNFCG